jgi:hypothetical protein
MRFPKVASLLLILCLTVGCSTSEPPRFKSREQTSVNELVQMFGPVVKHYKVPGHERYEVVVFRPLFQNWRERIFLYKDGHYFDQASGQYVVAVRAMKNGDVRLVKTGKDMGPPIGAPRPRGGYSTRS